MNIYSPTVQCQSAIREAIERGYEYCLLEQFKITKDHPLMKQFINFDEVKPRNNLPIISNIDYDQEGYNQAYRDQIEFEKMINRY